MNIDNGYAETLRNLVPSSPALGAEYVARDAENAGVAWDVPDRLRVITAAGQRVRALIHGTAGVGKSTELQLWARSLSDSFEVIYVEIADVRGGIDAILVKIVSEMRLEMRVLKNTGRLDEVKKILAGLAGVVAGGSVERGARALVTGAWAAESKPPTMRELFARTMALPMGDRPLLLLIDGLDRLPLDDVATVLSAGSPLFDDIVPSIVCTAPHARVLTQSRETWDPRITDIWHLPAFSVIKPDGSPNSAAVEALAQGLGRRLSALPAPVPVELLQRVALMSGGIPRHAIQILRTAVLTGARQLSLLLTGVPLLLQRCGRSETADDFSDWDARRPTLASVGHPLLVLLDIASSKRLLRDAPQTVSWAGGIQLADPPTVRPVRSDDELQVAEAAWKRVLAENPDIVAQHRSQIAALDLGSRRLFFERTHVPALYAAQEALDEGLVYIVQVPS